MTNVTTFYVCSISAFSALKAALSSVLKIAQKAWRSDNKKSSPNRSQSEIWYRGAVRGHQRSHLRRYLQAQGNSDQKITKKGVKLERRNPVQLINVTGSILTLSSKTNMSTPQNHVADILAKGTFTRDAWHHLLRLFNIMNISMFCHSFV